MYDEKTQEIKKKVEQAVNAFAEINRDDLPTDEAKAKYDEAKKKVEELNNMGFLD